MEISITHSLPFSNPVLKTPTNKKLSLSSDTSSPPPEQPFHVTAGSPPSTRTITRRRPRASRRVRRKSGVQENDEISRFLDFSGNGGGIFGKGGSGGGGGNNSGGWNWDGFSEGDGDSSIYDPAFDFVYGVLCWIALSNCLLFSFKRVVRLFGDRDKVSVEITTTTGC